MVEPQPAGARTAASLSGGPPPITPHEIAYSSGAQKSRQSAVSPLGHWLGSLLRHSEVAPGEGRYLHSSNARAAWHEPGAASASSSSTGHEQAGSAASAGAASMTAASLDVDAAVSFPTLASCVWPASLAFGPASRPVDRGHAPLHTSSIDSTQMSAHRHTRRRLSRLRASTSSQDRSRESGWCALHRNELAQCGTHQRA
jgi:hypothetical protein